MKNFIMYSKFQELESWQLAYIAGIVDGEGCIGLYSKSEVSMQQTMQINMASPVCLKWLYTITGLGAMHFQSKAGKTGLYNWGINDRIQLYIFLKAIYPYLILKQEQAGLVMEYIERRMNGAPLSAYDLGLCDRIKELKKLK